MLIEDGKRLYMVSDDPAVQQKMRELDGGTAQKLKLSDLPATESSVEAELESEIDIIKNDFDLADMSKTMQHYCEFSNETNSSLKAEKGKVLKELIMLYLVKMEQAKAEPKRKFVKMFKEIGPFVKKTYVKLMTGKGYSSFKAYCSSNENFEADFNTVMAELKRRAS